MKKKLSGTPQKKANYFLTGILHVAYEDNQFEFLHYNSIEAMLDT